MKQYIQQISNYIKSGTSKKQLLGLEVEHFITNQNNESVFYDKIKNVLLDLAKYYDKQILSNNSIIGLKRDDAEISLEPGAQFEVAIAPKKSVEEIETVYNKFLSELIPVLNSHNLKLNTNGYRRDLSAYDVPIIPKNRYIAMDSRFKTIDKLGPFMMRNTASTQVSIDFEDEQDCINKLKVATCLAPIIYFLLDNSLKDERMTRYKIWNNTDPDRCGSLDIIFDNNFTINEYSKKITSLPLIYARGYMKNLSNLELATKIGDDLFYGPYSTDEIITHDNKLTPDEINQILTMIFYDARLKNLIELRGADSMPKEFIFAYCSLIQDIFYKNKTTIFNESTYDDYVQAGENLYKYGWDANVYGYKVDTLLHMLTDNIESDYFKPIKELIDKKQVLKDYLNIKNIEERKNTISKTTYYTNKQLKYYLDNNECIEDRKKIFNNHTKSKAEYWDEIVNMGYFSKVFDIYNTCQFSDICATLHKILNKVINEYYTNQDYRNLFNYDSFTEKLINIKPKYKDLLPMARFDIFFNEETGNFGICEFNTGGSAAMSEVSYLCEEIQHAKTFKLLNNPKAWELYDSWTEEFIKLYKQVKNNKPTIAIVDFLDNCQYVDFPLFKKSFEEKGYKCLICDLRDLHYDGKLKYKDTIIDAVYKRVTLDDLIKLKEDKGVKAFLKAVDEEQVVSIDWFNTQIIHDKQICKVLFNELNKKILTKSEWNFIQLHLPKLYKSGNKDNYIAKPISSRGAKNIYVGCETDEETWNKVIKDKNYIVQEYCEQYYSPNVYIDAKDKERSLQTNSVKQFSNMEGLYCYHGKFSGIYLRAGSKRINAQKYDNIVIPTFYDKEI